MEGQKILNGLLKKQLDGLYDDTKNYIATFTRVLEPGLKNGLQFNSNGCNTSEQIVSKYSAFCNKFLRCAIEAIKSSKDSEELREILKTVDMVLHALDMVLIFKNGKYHKCLPSLAELGTKLYHISNQLISKNVFDVSIEYVDYFIKYVQLAKTQDKTCIKELHRVAKSMATLCWRSAALIEQSSKGVPKASVNCNVLKWRLHGVTLDAEYCTDGIPSLITKAASSVAKFKNNLSTLSKDVDGSTLSYLTTSFDSLCNLLHQKNSKNGLDFKSIDSLFDFGISISRVFQTMKSRGDIVMILEKLQCFTNEMLKTLKSNSSESSTLSKFCSCNISLIEASSLFGDILSKSNTKSNRFEKLDKHLNHSIKALESFISMKIGSFESVLQTIKHLASILQTSINVKSTKTPENGITMEMKDLPDRTLNYLQTLFGIITDMLMTEVETVNCQNQQQQFHRAVSSYMSLSALVMHIYKHQIETLLKSQSQDKSIEVMTKCLQYSKQVSDSIKDLIPRGCNSQELMWNGQITFKIGMVAYRHDVYHTAAELMSQGCNDVKFWCLHEDQNALMANLQQAQLLTMYEALRDCQRRSLQYQAAFDSSTLIIELVLCQSLKDDLQSSELHIQNWIQSKHELINKNPPENASQLKSRTIIDVMDSSSIIPNAVDTTFLLQQELECCKALNARYDTLCEQSSITLYLMKLYKKENSFKFATATLEHIKTQHLLGKDQCIMDMWQEMITILESEVTELSMVTLQDTKARAYFWKGIFQHKALSRKQVEEQLDSQQNEQEKMDKMEVSLEQPFVLSLHTAVDTWTSLVENLIQESHCKMELSQLDDPIETINCLEMVGLLYTSLKQPLNQVHANYLCALISQALGRWDTAVNAYVQAIHTLCGIHDVYHAQQIMIYCKQIEEENTLQKMTTVQLLLARCHLHLEMGHFGEGEKCLSQAFESDVLHKKECTTQIVLQSMAYSLLAQYLQIPSSVFVLNLGTYGEDMTPIDAAVESISKIESIVKEVYNKIKSDEYSAEGSKSLKLLIVSNKLLDCQMQCGNMMVHQGLIKYAVKYFRDGLALSKKMALPYRYLEFSSRLTDARILKGDYSSAEECLMKVAKILDPVLQHGNNTTSIENHLQVPPLVNHPDACQHVCCTDPTMHSLVIGFFITLAKYLTSQQEHHKQAIKALDIADQLISHAIHRLKGILDTFSILLELGNKSSCTKPLSTKSAAKKKTARGKQSNKIASDNNLTIQLMHSDDLCQVFVENALILVDKLKVKKALDVVKDGINAVKTIEKTIGSIPIFLTPIMSHLLYIQGLSYLVGELQNNPHALECIWDHHAKNTTDVNDVSSEIVSSTIKPKRKARGRNAKAKETAPEKEENKAETTVKGKRKGRSKTVGKETQENREATHNEG